MADAPSDADRDEAVRALTRHCGDGRITLDELEHRISEVYAASRMADIDHALRELPRPAPAPTTRPSTGPPVRSKPAMTADRRAEMRKTGEIALQIHLWIFIGVMLMLTAIWFLTSPFGYYWPIWTAVPWGTGVIIHAAIHKTVNGD